MRREAGGVRDRKEEELPGQSSQSELPVGKNRQNTNEKRIDII